MADDKTFLEDSRQFFNLSNQLRSSIPDAKVVSSLWDFNSPFWAVWRSISDKPDQLDSAKNKVDFEDKANPADTIINKGYLSQTFTPYHVPSVEEVHDPTVRKFDKLIPLDIEYVSEGLQRLKLFQGNRYSIGDAYVFSGNKFFIGQSFTAKNNDAGSVCQFFTLRDGVYGSVFDISGSLVKGQTYIIDTPSDGSLGQLFIQRSSDYVNMQMFVLRADYSIGCMYALDSNAGANQSRYWTAMLGFYTGPNVLWTSGVRLLYVFGEPPPEPTRAYIGMLIKESTPLTGLYINQRENVKGYGIRMDAYIFSADYTPFLIKGGHGAIRINGDMWARQDPNYNLQSQMGLIMLQGYISNTISFDFMNVRKTTTIGAQVEALVVRVDGQLRAIPLHEVI